jgi:molybdenum-dependent DNA-binding transcriptional regulator ModE
MEPDFYQDKVWLWIPDQVGDDKMGEGRIHLLRKVRTTAVSSISAEC